MLYYYGPFYSSNLSGHFQLNLHISLTNAMIPITLFNGPAVLKFPSKTSAHHAHLGERSGSDGAGGLNRGSRGPPAAERCSAGSRFACC